MKVRCTIEALHEDEEKCKEKEAMVQLQAEAGNTDKQPFALLQILPDTGHVNPLALVMRQTKERNE